VESELLTLPEYCFILSNSFPNDQIVHLELNNSKTNITSIQNVGYDLFVVSFYVFVVEVATHRKEPTQSIWPSEHRQVCRWESGCPLWCTIWPWRTHLSSYVHARNKKKCPTIKYYVQALGCNYMYIHQLVFIDW
jgi:hypothetical protein